LQLFYGGHTIFLMNIELRWVSFLIQAQLFDQFARRFVQNEGTALIIIEPNFPVKIDL
jgi:hypothetical protein